MAPTRTVRSKHALKASDSKRDSVRSHKKKTPQPRQTKVSELKSKRPNVNGKSRQKRTYTDKELGLPKLNTIVPAGVEKPKGKKKGKVFVDDAESMMTILAMVNADKEGQIESKMLKARQLEEIRIARTKETEKREQLKARKLEETKKEIKKGKKNKPAETGVRAKERGSESAKKVAFA